jgi:molecular chaperone DnaJ
MAAEIFYEMPLSFVQAALGDEVTSPNCTRRCEIKNSCRDTKQEPISVLRGKGAPRLRGGSTGDQHVKVKIDYT